MKRFADPAVAAVFKPIRPRCAKRLMALRDLVFDVAGAHRRRGLPDRDPEVGSAELSHAETSSGSTVRIDRLKKGDGYALYFHCQSGLVPKFRELYPDTFRYEGKRALVFGAGERLPLRALRHCIGLALTHHRR